MTTQGGAVAPDDALTPVGPATPRRRARVAAKSGFAVGANVRASGVIWRTSVRQHRIRQTAAEWGAGPTHSRLDEAG
jgi:hypothetical protein